MVKALGLPREYIPLRFESEEEFRAFIAGHDALTIPPKSEKGCLALVQSVWFLCTWRDGVTTQDRGQRAQLPSESVWREFTTSKGVRAFWCNPEDAKALYDLLKSESKFSDDEYSYRISRSEDREFVQRWPRGK